MGCSGFRPRIKCGVTFFRGNDGMGRVVNMDGQYGAWCRERAPFDGRTAVRPYGWVGELLVVAFGERRGRRLVL